MAETETDIYVAQRRRWTLAAAIVIWTMVAWGGRIGLLEGGEDLWAWARIGGSIVVALIAGVVLVIATSARWQRLGLVLFVGWTALIWSRSLILNLSGSGSAAFKLVHTVLAAGFFGLAWWAWRTAHNAQG